MSTVIDRKVVEMRFDNKNFEKNVQGTMSSLDKLKEKLKLKDASKGFQDVMDKVKNFNLNGVTNAISDLSNKFGKMDFVAISVLNNITNSAINAGKKIVSALTIDPIKTGFSEYETQMNAIQTILANTESKGTTLQQVNRALDELNTYADKTIYNFTEMTKNIGTFTAAGIDLDTSVNAIQGIANLAAVSGSTSQQASTAMYQLSQALASGTVKLIDWNSVVNAGMGGQVFQDALKETARVHGIAVDQIIKEQGSFRESLSEGWVTSEILTETLEKFTMAAEEGTEEWENYKRSLKEKGYTDEQITNILKMGKTATEAATKVKTVTQLWSTLQESAQSGWTNTWELIVGDFGEAKEFLTMVSDTIGGMLSASADARNTLLEGGLSTGWKQLLGAGIADEEGFKDSIKNVARDSGFEFEKLIAETEKNGGDFDDALKKALGDGNITADMLTKSVSNLSEKMQKMNAKEREAAGYTTEHVQEIKKLDEALKNGSMSMDDFVKKMTRSSGRENLIEALTNSFKGLMNIINPVKEAYRDIFPKMTGEELYKITENIKEMTLRFAEFTEKHGPKVKSTFKGVFAVLDVGVSFVSKIASGIFRLLGNFTDLFVCLLTGTATLGDWLSNTRDSIKGADMFGKAIDKVVGILEKGINKVKEFGSGIKESFKANGYEGFVGFLKGVWEFVCMIGDGIADALGNIGKNIAEIFNANTFSDVINSGIFTGLLLNLFKTTNSLSNITKSIFGKDGILDNATGVLEGVGKCLKAYQQQIQAGTLIKIATAVGILAGSILLIGSINPDTLGASLSSITVLFAELAATLAVLPKVTNGIRGVIKTSVLANSMNSIAKALLIMAVAMKIVSTINIDAMFPSLLAMASGIAIMVAAVNFMPEKVVIKAAKAIRKLSTSMIVLGVALKIMSTMSFIEIANGLFGVAGGLTAMVLAVNALPDKMVSKATGMIAMSTSLVILAGAMKIFGSMDIKEIGKSLLVLAGSMLFISKAMIKMPPNMISIGIGLIGVSTALVILSKALKTMGGMSWDEIGHGIVVLGSSLLILAGALKLMNGSLSGSAALLVASVALNVLGSAIKKIGSLDPEVIGKGLLTIVGALAILGIAGALLAPTVPVLLSLAGAFALFGAGSLAIGIGLGLMATGITLLAGALATGATAIVAGITVIITGLLSLIPSIIKIAGEAIAGFAKVIGDSAPLIAVSILKLIAELLKVLATYTPVIADSLFELLIGVINVVAERMPELISSTLNLFNSFFKGVADGLSGLDGANLLKGAIAVGIMAGLVTVLAGVSTFIGPAMIGLLGVGALVAELALVLAAIGGLAQIPGLSWLIGEGGDLLEKLGTAIGQFIGGLVGGIAQGFTNSLPDMAEDLSEFMEKIQPFIYAASSVDNSLLSGVKTLASAILIITGTNIVTSLASFFTGKDSLSEFGDQLKIFGKSMKAYGKEVSGVDSNAIMASANAAKALTEVAKAIPNGIGLFDIFTGSNDLISFAIQLVPFGIGLKKYAEVVDGVNVEAISASAKAAKALAEMANVVPNEGGIKAWFTGDNSLSKFAGHLKPLGKGLKDFSKETSGIVPENIKACSDAAKTLAEMTAVIPNEGGMKAWFTGENSVSKFATNLKSLGTGLKKFAEEVVDVDPEVLKAASSAAKSLAEMFAVIPNEGGMAAWFTGENSVAKFSENLKSLGIGLKSFANETAEIAPENIVSAANAAKAIAEMTKSIPNEGGVKAWFSGEASISNFANNLPDLGSGLKGFSDAIVGIDATNMTAAASAAKSLAEMVSVIPTEGGIKAWFTGETSISKFADKLPDLGKGLKGFSDSVVDIVPANVTAAANAAKALGEMTSVIPKNTDKIGSFGSNIVTFGGKLKSYFDKTSGLTADNIKVTSDAVESVKNISKNVNSEAIVSLSEAISKLIKSLTSMTTVSKDTIKGFSDAMTELGNINVTSIIDAFNNAETKLKDAGVSVIDKVMEGIKSKDTEMTDTGSASITKFAEGIAANNEKLNTACGTLVSNSSKAIKGHMSKFYDAGKHLVEGFAQGISMNTFLATAKAKAMAKAAEQAARDELKINSPSKVFRSIGAGIPEGLAQGISMFGSSIKNSIKDMGNTAISNTNRVLSRLIDSINIDSQPTIRPILDLSDIESGASSISGMFGNVGIGANLNAISVGMSTRNQNGVNADVVSAIDKLRRDIGNVGGTTNNYNFDGISYNGDSDIADAVEAIVRAVKIGRRA